MKTSKEAWLIGILSFIVFFFGNLFFGSIAGMIIPGGNDFQNSYFYPLYVGVNTLIALVISCTFLIIKKIELLLEEKSDDK